ncbi:glycosyltransferase [Acidisphaera sp. L21]|uniref:glycosyltransferase family 2 protein n=1 Tax=Acidisphaera sp. L21 TaxID=1641851 RepID=UPI00131D499C|nr:glycosyltransferase [Acidisphaera sp. L21]
MSTPTASVVICTFNRLRMLQDAVESCLANATSRGVAFEVVIADNSPSGHARAFANGLIAAGRVVRWVHASPPNISVARNAGLHAASAELVAFMDDDLVLEPGWLDHLLDTLERSGADVAVGPVRPRFAEGSAPDWDPQGSRFTRVLPAPSGTHLVAGGPNRTRNFAISTASSLWRRSTCFTDDAPFDPAFGASGGEDLDLFLRLERRGRRFVWCAEATVWETIPAGRTTLRYQALRAYSGAQVYTAAAVRHAVRPGRSAADIMGRGAIQAVAGAGALLLTGLTGRQRFVRHLLGTASAAGKLFWWRKIPLYHVEKAPQT